MYVTKDDVNLMYGYLTFYKTKMMDDTQWKRGSLLLQNCLKDLFDRLKSGRNYKKSMGYFYENTRESFKDKSDLHDFFTILASKTSNPASLLHSSRRNMAFSFYKDIIHIEILRAFYDVLMTLNRSEALSSIDVNLIHTSVLNDLKKDTDVSRKKLCFFENGRNIISSPVYQFAQFGLISLSTFLAFNLHLFFKYPAHDDYDNYHRDINLLLTLLAAIFILLLFNYLNKSLNNSLLLTRQKMSEIQLVVAEFAESNDTIRHDDLLRELQLKLLEPVFVLNKETIFQRVEDYDSDDERFAI
ncbi:hypothetical protein [Legionella spiritensis]|uniref:hypothetical protein n=1 Tax=Legionella spiritensis TaxID=452 RepID=UPI000F707801|nr:hypothetical protein [Legionella spiritensis]VEG90283.1 Uncharacterised protein [Legionella spiritensis]